MLPSGRFERTAGKDLKAVGMDEFQGLGIQAYGLQQRPAADADAPPPPPPPPGAPGRPVAPANGQAGGAERDAAAGRERERQRAKEKEKAAAAAAAAAARSAQKRPPPPGSSRGGRRAASWSLVFPGLVAVETPLAGPCGALQGVLSCPPARYFLMPFCASLERLGLLWMSIRM